MRAQSPQLCWTLCDPTDCSPLGSSVHGTLQERILEWVAMPFSRVLPEHVSFPNMSPALQMDSVPTEPPGKPIEDFSTLLKYLAHAQPSSGVISWSTRKVPWLIFHPVSWSPVTSPITGFQPFIRKVRLLTIPPPNH